MTRPVTTSAWADRAWTRLRLHLSDPARRSLPEVTIETAPTVRGWVFRAALLALVPLLVLTAAFRTPGLEPALVWTLVALCTGLLVVHPTPTTAGGAIALSGVLLWGFTAEPFDPWSLVVALLGYLVARTAWWAAHVPFRGRAEVAVLTVGWRRDAVVLGGTGILGGLAMLASGATLRGAVLLAALAVAGLALVALATGGTARDDGRD
ncbi:hypothetical protein [Promicromonospora soli]|uniref:Uncharacterized protein n=1 Tax=Promicromonospora soli TaxID=2035533 RepID=A0A919KY29_9MICO|nr:hypothetical protein [Promicromonospora soli]GHH77530.1 hypothetical protein GCM10017772_38750 [Promicromonospora soli]